MPSELAPVMIDGIATKPLQELLSDMIKTTTVPAINTSAGLMGAAVDKPFNPPTPIENVEVGDTSFATYAARLEKMLNG